MSKLRPVAAALLVAALTPTAVAECDAAQPTLTGFDFDPKLIDVGPGPQGVTCTMSFTDDVSGVDQAICTFSSPTFLQTRSCSADAPSSGNRLNGTFTCTVEFPEHVENGVWTVNSVQAIDRVDRNVSVSSFELQASGYPTELSVTSPQPDLTGPEVDAFDFVPKSVDVTVSGQDVTCTMDWSDPLAGVSFAQCAFDAPSSDQAQGCVAFDPIAGTPNDGTYECTFTIPRYAEDGTWTASAFATDTVGNSNGLDADGLAGQGFPTDLQVTSEPDLVVPTLDDFVIEPTSLNVSSSSDTVTCTMTVRDTLSGVQFASCQIGLFEGFTLLTHECFAETPKSGTRNDGVFECSIVIPAYSPGGTWQIQNVELADQAGNAETTPTADLAAQGFPTDVQVSCDGSGGGEQETTLSWADKETLTWDPIADAVEYNVYRGPISDLVDADGDGLPDAGYGECQNSSDPDTTDTQFSDAEAPAPSQGFFYLVAYDTASQSALGLGTTSGGLDRSPGTPCP